MAIPVQQWLLGQRNYQDGLEILIASGASTLVIQILSSGPDQYNTRKLLKALQALAEKEPAAPVAPALLAPAAAEPPKPAPAYVPNNDLEKKLRLDQKIRDLWKEMTHLHGQLSVLPEGERLLEVVQQLQIKRLKRQDLYDQLHFFNTHGKWFDDLPENQPKPANIEQEIKNARSNRSKAKSKLSKPLPADKKAYYEMVVADWEKRIDTLTSQLNG